MGSRLEFANCLRVGEFPFICVIARPDPLLRHWFPDGARASFRLKFDHAFAQRIFKASVGRPIKLILNSRHVSRRKSLNFVS